MSSQRSIWFQSLSDPYNADASQAPIRFHITAPPNHYLPAPISYRSKTNSPHTNRHYNLTVPDCILHDLDSHLTTFSHPQFLWSTLFSPLSILLSPSLHLHIYSNWYFIIFLCPLDETKLSFFLTFSPLIWMRKSNSVSVLFFFLFTFCLMCFAMIRLGALVHWPALTCSTVELKSSEHNLHSVDYCFAMIYGSSVWECAFDRIRKCRVECLAELKSSKY